jgi:RNA polymerase sigma-70 factor, ECF subfamily
MTLAITPLPRVQATLPASTVDEALLVRLRAGEDEAYDELVRLAGGWMLALARRMLGREDDAQDAVQDAFLSAFKSLENFDERSQFTTWLHRIVVNACLMKLRTRRRKPERPISDFLPRFLPDGHQEFPTQSWKPDAAAGIERDELRTLLRSKIDELPEPFREVLLLRDIEELDTEATASLLGTTPSAVKTRLHRARQALRTLLEPHFAETYS